MEKVATKYHFSVSPEAIDTLVIILKEFLDTGEIDNVKFYTIGEEQKDVIIKLEVTHLDNGSGYIQFIITDYGDLKAWSIGVTQITKRMKIWVEDAIKHVEHIYKVLEVI